jgi:hypothetical protein
MSHSGSVSRFHFVIPDLGPTRQEVPIKYVLIWIINTAKISEEGIFLLMSSNCGLRNLYGKLREK